MLCLRKCKSENLCVLLVYYLDLFADVNRRMCGSAGIVVKRIHRMEQLGHAHA